MSPSPKEQSEAQLIDSILGKGVTIPPQPKVMLDIEKALAKTNVNVGAIAKLIGQDAALTASIFKVIRSPVYGQRNPTDSLEKAISIIGLNQIVNIVKSTALRHSLDGKEESYNWFWERSADIAELCSIIAWKQRSVCNIFPDQAYMVGLFHDCGVPVLFQRFPEYCKAWRKAPANSDWPNLDAEDDQFSTNHAVVGYLVARHWRLPDFIAQAVRFHHEILNTEHKATTSVAILQMAMHIHNTYAQIADNEWERVKPRVLEELGMGEEGLREFEEDVYDTLKENR